jgi:transglutaminase-like putative cysteine protease
MYETDAEIAESGIVVEGVAMVYPRARDSGSNEASLENGRYLEADTYWEVDDSTVKAKADELTAGKASNYAKAEAIYDYVVDTLTYNSEASLATRERKGGKETLSSPEDCVCQEFSDLFIALSRAAGVPAREVAGYAEDVLETESEELVLHSWVEFWDQDYGWVMADPTWANNVSGNYFNNVGSDHLVMLIRGEDSVSPSIVTAFLSDDDPADNVFLESTITVPAEEISAEVSFGGAPTVRGDVEVLVSNTGNRALTMDKMNVTIDGNPQEYSDAEFLVLPDTEQAVSVESGQKFVFMKTTKNVSVDANFYTYEGNVVIVQGESQVELSPILPWVIIIPAGVVFLAILLWLTIKWIRS